MGIIQKQAIKGTFYTYAGAIIGFVTVGLLFPKYLETDQIGLLNILVSYSAILAQFASLGFNNVTSKLFPYFRNREKGHNGFLFLISMIIFVGSILIIALMLIYSNTILPNKKSSSPLFYKFFWFIYPITFFTLLFNLLDNYNKVLYNAVRGIILKEFVVRIAVILLILTFAFSFIDFDELVNIYSAVYCIPAIIIFLLLLREKQLDFKPRLKFIDKKLRKELISVSLFGLAISAAGVITINIDRVMLESLIPQDSLSAVGIYSTAFFFGTIIVLPSRALIKISSTLVAEAWKRNEINTVFSIYKKSVNNLFIVGLLLFVGLWVNIDNVFDILPEEFGEGKLVILFIGLAYLSDMLSGTSATILSSSKYYKYQAYIIISMTILVIVTNAILIPSYGIVGAAFGSLFSKVIVNIARFVFLKIKFGFQPYNITTLIVLAIGMFSYIVGYFLPSTDSLVLNLMIKSIPTVLVYLSLVIFTHSSEEFSLYYSSLIKKLRN